MGKSGKKLRVLQLALLRKQLRKQRKAPHLFNYI